LDTKDTKNTKSTKGTKGRRVAAGGPEKMNEALRASLKEPGSKLGY
jgi:hypothetical protein